MTFAGFPEAAFDFYEDLEMDNSKTFWDAHKTVYEKSVKTPMVALLEELEPEFGEAKLFRPYRDVRFSKDKTPYKIHQGAYVAAAPATGWYAELSAAGFRVGGGFYDATPLRLKAIRHAIDSPASIELDKLLTRLKRSGWTLGGDVLKTAPRGYDADHPRIELLKHKSLTLGKTYGFDSAVHTAGLTAKVAKDWRLLTPLVDWVCTQISGIE
ncbi:DUF2461 domain-containing protein [Luteipulveratus mongoliensis]|uniref:TIGR02453 family protein n=1 Tax=Luteipulveratus mongoliensis TaxID=571913 RepID=A0A0K1JGV8_9MICO|nr:DUF2461 domain-containing protein [Luteipulveratus mongoliensis]AKU15941.1 hypothetical protein VV02_08865 [Luteipulveratus mongoliensis]